VLLEGWSAAARGRIVQVAVAGRWEEARRLRTPASAARARSLLRDAAPAGAELAVEREWLGYPLVFVGARRAQGEPADFEARAVDVAVSDRADPALTLAVLAGGPPAELEHVELGAANAWRSVGPLRLWTRGEPHVAGTLAARLRDHPGLARCEVPVALAIAFRRPRECWIGVEVSEPRPDGHVVVAAKVERLLTALLPSG
jgi:hypothetical protein